MAWRLRDHQLSSSRSAPASHVLAGWSRSTFWLQITAMRRLQTMRTSAEPVADKGESGAEEPPADSSRRRVCRRRGGGGGNEAHGASGASSFMLWMELQHALGGEK